LDFLLDKLERGIGEGACQSSGAVIRLMLRITVFCWMKYA
jgi:hypothetical protein